MPLETASYIAQLDANNPQDGESAEKGDDHLRLIKNALKQSFPNIGGAMTLTQDELNSLPGDITTAVDDLKTELAGHLVPTGTILLWSGATVDIPVGWALCDGANGTPDLRGRFLVGAGGSYAVDATGGSASATSSASGDHNHGGSTAGHALTVNEMPSHSHGLSGKEVYHKGGTEYDILANDGRQSTGTVLNAEGGNNPHSHGIGASGTHTHTVATLPPYYALAYIVKTSTIS